MTFIAGERVWPTSLPIEPHEYTETLPDQLIRQSMDVGPAKVRRRTTAAVRKFACTYIFSPVDTVTFDNFLMVTLEGGSLGFTFPHPRISNTTIEVYFAEIPRFKHLGARYHEVAISLEVIL